jgi:hypothetical protein
MTIEQLARFNHYCALNNLAEWMREGGGVLRETHKRPQWRTN